MPARSPKRALARGQVIHRQQCVRLATTEGSLQLDDRLAAFAIEPLRHLGEQASHALGDEGALVECLRVAVFRGRLARAHRCEVGGKLGLLERAIQHVRVGNDDFSPRFQAHKVGPLVFKARQPCASAGLGALAAADSMPVQLVMSSL